MAQLLVLAVMVVLEEGEVSQDSFLRVNQVEGADNRCM
jgi:hypothetical protein